MSLRRTLPVVILVAAAVAALLALTAGGDGGRTLRAVFDDASNFVAGQEVQVAGRKVGSVTDVTYADGQAVLELQIDDDRVWPLHHGTVALIRATSTISVHGRYVELTPGPASAPPLKDGGVLTRSDTLTRVEFDELFDIFDGKTRGALGDVVSHGGAAFGGQQASVNRALRDAPGGFESLEHVLGRLGEDREALRTLLDAGARTTRAIADRDMQLRSLLGTAAMTFDTTAARATALRTALHRMPATLVAARGTLGRMDGTIDILDGLLTDLRPGARRLATIAGPVQRTVAQLRSTAPLLTATLRQGTSAAPPITAFLRTANPVIGRLGRVARDVAPDIACIRPYGPEIAGWATNWASWAKNYDSEEHYWRTLIQTQPFPNFTPLRSQDVVGKLPGLKYSFPRPAGWTGGDTWLRPSCEAGSEALDATQDPESRG